MNATMIVLQLAFGTTVLIALMAIRQSAKRRQSETAADSGWSGDGNYDGGSGHHHNGGDYSGHSSGGDGFGGDSGGGDSGGGDGGGGD